MSNPIKVFPTGTSSSTLLYYASDGRKIDSLKATITGDITTKPSINDVYTNIELYNNFKAVKVRVHLLIWQPNGSCYHASSIEDDLKVEKEHLIKKEESKGFFKKVYDSSIFYGILNLKDVDTSVYLLAVPFKN